MSMYDNEVLCWFLGYSNDLVRLLCFVFFLFIIDSLRKIYKR